MPAYVSIRQHTSAYVSIRQHTSACIRQHTYVSNTEKNQPKTCLQRSAAVALTCSSTACIRSACVSKHTSAQVSIRQHTSAHRSIRQHGASRVRSLGRQQEGQPYIYFMTLNKENNNKKKNSSRVQSLGQQEGQPYCPSLIDPRIVTPCLPYVRIPQHTSAYVRIRQDAVERPPKQSPEYAQKQTAA